MYRPTPSGVPVSLVNGLPRNPPRRRADVLHADRTVNRATADLDVVAVVGGDHVDPGAAVEEVRRGAAVERVGAGVAVQAVGVGAAVKRVVSGVAAHRVAAGLAVKAVVAVVAAECVVAGTAGEHVIVGFEAATGVIRIGEINKPPRLKRPSTAWWWRQVRVTTLVRPTRSKGNRSYARRTGFLLPRAGRSPPP